MKTPQSPFLKAATKSPGQFTGKGAEIIGDPRKHGGELWYLNGVFRGITSEQPKPAKPKPVTIAQQAAWLNLSRQRSDSQDNREKAERERSEREDIISAQILAEHFAHAMLDGTLDTLARAVVKESNSIPKKSETKERKKARWEGYLRALHAVAFKSTHPEQVTIQAVTDHMVANHEIFKPHGFLASKIDVWDTRKGLKKIGFGWLEMGTKGQGRPRNPA